MDKMDIENFELPELKGELGRKEKIPFDIWFTEFENARNPLKRLALLLKLPFCCEQSKIDETKATKITEHFPSNILSQFILQQRDEDVVDLVATMVNILVPLCRTDDREKFRPLCEGMRESVCGSKGLTEVDIEIRLNALSLIGISYLSVDDINEILNAIVKYIKDNVDLFPSKSIMEFTIAGLKSLNNVFNTDSPMNSVALCWPSDLRIVIERIFRTYNIPTEYLTFSFVSAGLTSQVLGPVWLTSNTVFFQLLASLTSGRIRIETEDPRNINGEELVSCFQLEETFVNCIESDEFEIDDEVATAVGKSVQEAVSFCCEYLGVCAKQQVVLDMGLKLAFYRLICMFATVGGLKIIDGSFLTSSITSMLDVFEYAISQRDLETAGLLLQNLPDYPVLPRNTLELVLKYVQLMFPVDKTACIAQLSEVLAELKGRKDFYSSESLKSAANFANQTNSKGLIDVIKSY